MESFTDMEIKNEVISKGQYSLAVISFFCIVLGALSIGYVVGLLTALLTKLTQDKYVRIMEPLIVYATAFLAYMLAELFHWSGILSLIACGLTQRHYAFRNISRESKTAINSIIEMIR